MRTRIGLGILVAALLVAAQADAQAVTKRLDLRFGSATVDGAAVWQEIEDAVCAHYGYQATVPDPDSIVVGATKPNPETRAQFVRRQIKTFLRDHRTAYLDSLAAESGKAAARATRKIEAEAP